jgi:hypothetical protein
MTNPAHPRIHNPNGSKNWRDWLPKPPPPTTKRELQKTLADLAVQNVDVRDRRAAVRAGKSLEQYRADRHRAAQQQQITDAARNSVARLSDARRRRRW